MKRICILAACSLWLSASFVAFAQSASPPAPTKMKYDEASRIKLNGVVDDIEQRSLGGICKAPGIRHRQGEWADLRAPDRTKMVHR